MTVLHFKSYLDGSNIIKIQLKDNSSGTLANTDLTNADSVSVVVEGVEYNSDDYSNDIIFYDSGQIHLKMYNLLLAAGVYDCHILAYFGGEEIGKRWDDVLRIAVS